VNGDVMMSTPGRTFGELFDHPEFTGPDYVIRRTVPDLTDGMPAVEFRARLVLFEMPTHAGCA